MKTKSLFLKILPAALLLLLIVIVAFSCKKKDSGDSPVIPNPVTPVTPNIFGNQPPTLITNYEFAHGSAFQANLQYQLGEGLLGEGLPIPALPDGAMQVFDIVMCVYDHANEKNDDDKFKEINNNLANISNQITALRTQIDEVCQQLSLQTSELEQYFTTELFNSHAANIELAFSSGSSSGLEYYPKAALHLRQNGGTDGQWQALTNEMNNWVALQKGTFGAKTDVAQIHALLLQGGTLSASGLMPFTKTLVAQYTNSPSAKALANLGEAFLILESYFLTITNYQFKGATCYINACNATDTTGWEASNYIKTDFSSYILDELEQYLYAVDYLAVNLANFQTENKIREDLPFMQAGLSPDKVFNGPLCRAQLLSSILLQALSINFPCIAGVIITPHKNNESHLLQIDSISLSVNERTLGSTARDAKNGGPGIESQYYYAAWNNGNCTPDNYWNVYRFGKLGIADKSFKDANTLTVHTNGPNDPWYHTSEINGTLQTLYFNPNNLSDYSTSRRLGDIALAFFTERWVWGFPWITAVDGYQSVYAPDFVYRNGSSDAIIENPNVMTTTNNDGTQFNTYGGDGFHMPTLGTMYYSGSTVKTEYSYIVESIGYNNFQSSSPLPGNLTAYVYGAASVIVTSSGALSGNGGAYIGFMGLETVNKKLIYSILDTNHNFAQGYGNKDGISYGKETFNPANQQNIGIGLEYNVNNPGSVRIPITITNKSLIQVVYEGHITPAK